MAKTMMDKIWNGFNIEFPLYSWYTPITKQSTGCNTFVAMKESGMTWREFHYMIKDFEGLRNKYIGYNLGNGCTRLVREDKRFVFSIHLPYKDIDYQGSFDLWDDHSESLGHYVIENVNDVPTTEFIKWINQITEEYCRGLIHCSDCGKVIPRDCIAGRYYAGVYCDKCWEGKWKAIEANANYD